MRLPIGTQLPDSAGSLKPAKRALQLAEGIFLCCSWKGLDKFPSKDGPRREHRLKDSESCFICIFSLPIEDSLLEDAGATEEDAIHTVKNFRMKGEESLSVVRARLAALCPLTFPTLRQSSSPFCAAVATICAAALI